MFGRLTYDDPVWLKAATTHCATVVVREIDGQRLAVNVDTGRAFALGAISERMWTLVREHATFGAVIDQLCLEFDAPRATLLADLHRLIVQLTEADTPSDPVPSAARATRLRLSQLLVAPEQGLLPQPSSWDALLSYARQQRVHLLLASQLRESGLIKDDPESIGRVLEADLREAERHDVTRADDLRRVLSVLAGAGVRPLLFKGAQLAHTVYPQPHLRPLVDVDLFIRRDEADTVRQTMSRAGYAPVYLLEGDAIVHQFQYASREEGPCIPTYDFHWRLANPEVFAHVLSFDEAAAAAVAIPSLGSHARGFSTAHALMVACVHRVAHHYDAGDLIWLYDIHALAGRLSDDDWRTFARLVEDRQLKAVCARSLSRAIEAFDTSVPPAIRSAWAAARDEPTAFFLDRPMRSMDLHRSSLRELRTWRARWRFARQHAFPSPRYILDTYRVRSPIWLPALYIHRLIRGAIRWRRPAAEFRRTTASPSSGRTRSRG